jgi:MFS family permease
VGGALASFATLGVGFLARPLGVIIAGHVRDRYGRKRVLVRSLLLMGVATFCTGLLPTYAVSASPRRRWFSFGCCWRSGTARNGAAPS